jgi:hypothetical protein
MQPMKFLLTYAPHDQRPPTPETMAAIGQFSQEMTASGVLLMTGGLERPTKGLRLQYAKGKHSVLDGPFAETKELIDGFALIEVASREQALEVARRFMSIAGEGDGEILQVFEGGSIPQCDC